jgi:Ca2+-binding RTX toxin-like protein
VNRKTSLLAVVLTAIAAASTAPAVAAAPTLRVAVTDGALRISGAQFAENIALRLSALDRNQLQIDVDDDGAADYSFALATFEAIDIQAGNGDDTVRIDQVNGAFTTTKPTRINGENGDDTLIGGSGAEVFIGGNGDDLVDGNGGADTAFLGRGDDTFVWDPGDASDVVEGDSGADTMVFNGAAGSEIMAAAADGGRVVFTRNLGSIVMDLDDVEVIDVKALGGADTVTVNDVGGTDLERLDVDLAAALGGSTADGQADTVSVIGTTGDDSITTDANGAAVEVSGLAAFVRITHAELSLDKLAVDTLGGDDIVTVDPALDGLIQVSVQ